MASTNKLLLILILAATIFSTGCTNTVDDFKSNDFKEYYPLQIGKYITYRVDSIKFVNFQSQRDTFRYEIKHQVVELVADGEGKEAYKVEKLVRGISVPNAVWTHQGFYLVKQQHTSLETYEDNLRIVKLVNPLHNEKTWYGNIYLADKAYNGYGYDFTGNEVISEWPFIYELNETAFTYKGNNYTDLITVLQVDKSENLPVNASTPFASRRYGIEKYQKGVGMVYRNFDFWEYQKSDNMPVYTGFGVVMWMVDHN